MVLTLIARVGARPAFGGRYWDICILEVLVYICAIRRTKHKGFEFTRQRGAHGGLNAGTLRVEGAVASTGLLLMSKNIQLGFVYQIMQHVSHHSYLYGSHLLQSVSKISSTLVSDKWSLRSRNIAH
jgi:hypothetical protein